MITKLLERSRNLKRQIEHRLRPIEWEDQASPMLSATNIHYEVAEKTRGIDVGGIGAIHLLAKVANLPSAINSGLKLLKKHLPYWESDHVLNIAYNVMCGGRCLDDIDLRRNDAIFMDGLGAWRGTDRIVWDRRASSPTCPRILVRPRPRARPTRCSRRDRRCRRSCSARNWTR